MVTVEFDVESFLLVRSAVNEMEMRLKKRMEEDAGSLFGNSSKVMWEVCEKLAEKLSRVNVDEGHLGCVGLGDVPEGGAAERRLRRRRH